jgi:hypothetical protein
MKNYSGSEWEQKQTDSEYCDPFQILMLKYADNC